MTQAPFLFKIEILLILIMADLDILIAKLKDWGLDEVRLLNIPNSRLDGLAYTILKSVCDLKKIPTDGGAYWLVTNEIIDHKMHKNKIPELLDLDNDKFEIIYNGKASDLRNRAKAHLFRSMNKGGSKSQSSISVDIFTGKLPAHVSHIKHAHSLDNSKVPYTNDNKKLTHTILSNQESLTDDERSFVTQNKQHEIFFKNGIDVSDTKHCLYEYRFYYLPIISPVLRDPIEVAWRKKYNQPRLCTYRENR